MVYLWKYDKVITFGQLLPSALLQKEPDLSVSQNGRFQAKGSSCLLEIFLYIIFKIRGIKQLTQFSAINFTNPALDF